MSQIRVLHVVARMNVGGTAKYIADLVAQIPESALATGYVQGAEIEDPRVNSMKPYRIPHLGRSISPVNDLKSWCELRKLIRELQPHIVHTHTFKAGLIGRLVPGKHKRIHTFHGHLFADQSFSSTGKIVIVLVERFLAKRTQLLISVGSKVGSEIRSKNIGTRNSWTSIAPGVRALPVTNKVKARDLLNIDHRQLLVGWLARVTSVKNPLLLLQVARAMPDVKFVVGGGGDMFDAVKRTAPPNVYVLGWVDSALFWSAVDIAVSTSRNEGMPIALIEAQLAGLPVVATDVGSSSEIISEGITGRVVRENPQLIRDALYEIIQDPRKAALMSSASKDYAKKNFSVENMIVSHHQIYLQI